MYPQGSLYQQPGINAHNIVLDGSDPTGAPFQFQDLDAVSAPHRWTPLPVPRAAAEDVPCEPYFLPQCSSKEYKSDTDLFYMYGPSSMPAPSIISSHSSTTSPGSSASSTLSSIRTELPQHQVQQHHNVESVSVGHEYGSDLLAATRLPSPTEESEGTVRSWHNDTTFHAEETEDPARTTSGATAIHQPDSSHVCLWGSEGACKDGPFSTREALNWHVKAAHLLICPVLGCTEGAFAAKELVDVHLRCQHKHGNPIEQQGLCQPNDLLTKTPILRSTSKGKDNVVPAQASQWDCDETRIKLELTIATSKKRCRGQLKTVVEKRSRKQTATTPKSMDSPGLMRSSASRHAAPVPFPIIWEHGVLPFLIELMPKWCGPGHAISVTRGKKREARRICIMTAKPISKARKVVIAVHVQDLLPEKYRGLVSFVFSVGEVERLTWARGLGKDMPDEICYPRNPFCYVSPQMGDSIGMTLPDGDDTSATLGPCLKIGGAWFWLANFHPFEEADLTRQPAIVQHPSPEDRDRCLQENHDALEGPGLDLQLGQLTATSGYDLKTTRVSHDPYWEDCDQEPPLVVTDWALISSQKQQANMLRKFPSTATPQQEKPITRMCSIEPGAEVCTTGRTSGFQYGQVCEIPAYIDGRKNGTGKATREWFIEEPFECDEDSWIRGGIGVPGDSGAGVVDCETNALVGQLWGRNKYFGPGPRIAFFTPIFDVFDDIQERCGEQTRPQLPQIIQEADHWPAYPVCRPCFEVQDSMPTRPSSRASFFSMIPAAEVSGDGDHELGTISELATPKDGGDHGNWTRHAATMEAGTSFGSVVSPTPIMSTFFYQAPNPSPRPYVFDIKSPYAMDIRDEDLEDAIGDAPYNGPSKGHAGSAAMMRVSSHHSGKRRRIM